MSEMTFKDVSRLWKDEKRQFVKLSTFSLYSLIVERHLLLEFSDCVGKITEKEVQDFVLHKLASGMSRKSVKDMLVVLKMVYRFGVKTGAFAHCDWDVKFPVDCQNKDVEVLSMENQKRIVEYVNRNFTFKNLGVLLSLHTGMRIGEVCAASWGDVDLEHGFISITKTFERVYVVNNDVKYTKLVLSTPKTGNSIRDVPLSKTLIKLMKPLKRIVNDSYFIISNDLKPMEPRTYRNYYKTLMRELGIPLLKFHGLRHSFATRCIESNCDYKTVSVILGHSDVSTTLNLYVHPNMEQKKRCIDKMTRVFG